MKVINLPSGQERIEKAFQTASTTTGASFDYLVKTAVRESNLDPQAKAKTSTAAGTFQFIESTWLETLKQSGARFGLEKFADQIERSSNGRYSVADPAARREILDLRHDPEVSALMAGALTQKNAKTLENFLGRAPSDGELYIAHFLGASGAKRLIGLAESRPDANAASYFKAQAKANKPIFFDSAGQARSADAVYKNLVNRHDGTRLIGTALASVEPKPKPVVPTNTVTLAATPLAKPASEPFVQPVQIAAVPTHVAAFSAPAPTAPVPVDRVGQAWNVVAAGEDPAGLSSALQVAAKQFTAPNNRFEQTFQLANAAAKPANLVFTNGDLGKLYAGDFQRVTNPAAIRTHEPRSKSEQPVKVAALATPSTVIEAPGSGNPAANKIPDNPITTPFQVQAPKTAFESLYRTDALAPRTKVGETFALAYAAQTSLFSSPGVEAIDGIFGQSEVTSLRDAPLGSTLRPEATGRQPGLPLDLSEYLRVRPTGPQRELLPPV